MRISDVIQENSDLKELRLGRTNVGTKTAPSGDAEKRAALLRSPAQSPDVAKAYQSSISPGPSPQQTADAPEDADDTLSQPLPARDPNAPSLGQRMGGAIGKVGKGIGAIASVPQGVGRAVKKGYQAGVSAIGGPGAAKFAAPQGDEVADLINKINKLDRRLTRAGIPEQKKT